MKQFLHVMKVLLVYSSKVIHRWFIWELQETSQRRTNGCRGYLPLRRLGDVPLRRRWVFHLRLIWDVVETYWWDVVIMSPWDVVTTYQQDVVKTYHWDVLAMFHWDFVGCFIWDVPVTSLGRTKRRRYDVTTTSRWQVGLHVCVCEDKKNYSGKCFQPVRYRDYENLSNQKTPLEYNEVLNTYSFISSLSWNLLEGETLLVAVMKQWNGKKLEIIFIELVFSWWAWTKHMFCFHSTWICKDSVRLKATKMRSNTRS